MAITVITVKRVLSFSLFNLHTEYAPEPPLEGQRCTDQYYKHLVRKTGMLRIANAIGELYFKLNSYFISLIRWCWWF